MFSQILPISHPPKTVLFLLFISIENYQPSKNNKIRQNKQEQTEKKNTHTYTYTPHIDLGTHKFAHIEII